MTPQEAFTKVYLAVTKQGHASRVNSAQCCYLSPNGDRCGIGHLINDDTAFNWDHLNGCSQSIDKVPDLPPHLAALPMDMLIGMQQAHDRASDHHFVKDFQEAMQDVAHDYDLTVPVV